MERSKNENYTIFILICHVNKNETIAGKMKESHDADVVLYIKSDSDTGQCKLTFADKNTVGAKNRLGLKGNDLYYL